MSKERRSRAIRNRVRPLAYLPTWKVWAYIYDAKPRELRAILRAMELCTDTNCWFGEYHTAQILMSWIRARLFNIDNPTQTRQGEKA